jgi:hypothetical protein
MPQAILPLFSDDMIIINDHFAVTQKSDVIYWFQGSFPVFRHHVHDQASFRSFCCQLINLGNATSAEIARALKVNAEKLSRWARFERSASKDTQSTDTGKNHKNNKKKRPS